MSEILLSILIPTVVGREEQLRKLQDELFKQCKFHTGFMGLDERFGMGAKSDEVEMILCKDSKELTIGEKRELLYKKANGLYSWMIDDDDLISDNAIQLILEAIKSNPEVDCITFEEYVNIDGNEYKSNHSLAYSLWEGDGSKELYDGFHFHRTPFFKDVIKTEIAKSVPVSHIRWGEDNEYADRLLYHLRTEIHISQQLYRYIHISSPFNERYGISNI